MTYKCVHKVPTPLQILGSEPIHFHFCSLVVVGDICYLNESQLTIEVLNLLYLYER